jgi:anti-sigma factor RsiW
MNSNDESEIWPSCTDSYAELCALSITGELSPEERSVLHRHLISCEKCRQLVCQYESLANAGIAELVAGSNEPLDDYVRSWDEARARRRLLARAEEHSCLNPERPFLSKLFPMFSIGPAFGPANFVAAAILIAVSALTGFQLGKRNQSNLQVSESIRSSDLSIDALLAGLKSERATLKAELSTSIRTVSVLQAQTARQQAQLEELGHVRLKLQDRLQQLELDDEVRSNTLQSLSSQKDDLQHRLENAEESSRVVRDDLLHTQNERQQALFRVSMLEKKVDQLSAELEDSKTNIERQREFLASDQDIRDLVGARQLYIADVFDVDHNGNKRKTYGRIFYTKGKSLVFYAFDLDQQPGYQNAKAIHVWGSSSEDQSNAVNLGAFYLDSEANRRWIFKTEDRAALENINAVFVTIEPKESNLRSVRKPFLYAYLRTAPVNHP